MKTERQTERKKEERKERGENETCSTILNDDAKTQTTIMPSLTCTVVTFSHQDNKDKKHKKRKERKGEENDNTWQNRPVTEKCG